MDELYHAPQTTNKMRAGATAFLEHLRPDQRARAMFEFDNEAARRDWDYVPKQGRLGVPVKDLDSHQLTIGHTLLATSLSLPGYAKAISIMQMENLLRELQRERIGHWAGDFRNPGLYFFCFFGHPNQEATWGWRLSGHHLSLNFTVVNGEYLAPTPNMMGLEPAGYGVIRPLQEDEELGFGLLYSLKGEQRDRAVVHDTAPSDFVTRVVPKIGEEEIPDEYELGFLNYRLTPHDRQKLKYVKSDPKGLPGSAMNDEQRRKLSTLVECYVNRMAEDVAQKHLARLENAGLDEYFFAWAGKQENNGPHYYRIQGPSFLVEFENVQSNGNHIHTVWRNPDNDFGADLLLRHYEEYHGVLITRTTSSSH